MILPMQGIVWRLLTADQLWFVYRSSYQTERKPCMSYVFVDRSRPWHSTCVSCLWDILQLLYDCSSHVSWCIPQKGMEENMNIGGCQRDTSRSNSTEIQPCGIAYVNIYVLWGIGMGDPFLRERKGKGHGVSFNIPFPELRFRSPACYQRPGIATLQANMAALSFRKVLKSWF